MRRVRRVIALAAGVSALPIALAHGGPPAATAKKHLDERTPAPELKLLAPLAGTWQCEGKTSGDSPIPFKATIQVKLDLKGFWYAFNYDQKGPMQPLSLRGWMGHTPIDGKYPFVTFNTWGGVVTLSSSGWEGDRLVFSGAAVGIANVPTRYTFTRSGDKAFVGKLESQGQDGGWMGIYEESCRKGGK